MICPSCGQPYTPEHSCPTPPQREFLLVHIGKLHRAVAEEREQCARAVEAVPRHGSQCGCIVEAAAKIRERAK